MKIFIPRCTCYKQNDVSDSRWRTDAILKIVFGYISPPRADTGQVTKSAIFANSRWRTAAILKIALCPYLSPELCDFDQILYLHTNIHSEDGPLTKYRNISNSSSRTDAILKIVLSYISARLPQRRNPLTDLDVS